MLLTFYIDLHRLSLNWVFIMIFDLIISLFINLLWIGLLLISSKIVNTTKNNNKKNIKKMFY